MAKMSPAGLPGTSAISRDGRTGPVTFARPNLRIGRAAGAFGQHSDAKPHRGERLGGGKLAAARRQLAGAESHPDDLRSTRARLGAIEGDEAVLGITWFATDALGELVHYEPPRRGRHVTRISRTARWSRVRAVSDVIRAALGAR